MPPSPSSHAALISPSSSQHCLACSSMIERRPSFLPDPRRFPPQLKNKQHEVSCVSQAASSLLSTLISNGSSFFLPALVNRKPAEGLPALTAKCPAAWNLMGVSVRDHRCPSGKGVGVGPASHPVSAAASKAAPTPPPGEATPEPHLSLGLRSFIMTWSTLLAHTAPSCAHL